MLEPATLQKMNFWRLILKDIAKLLVNLHKHLLLIRYVDGFLQLFKTLAKIKTK